MRTKAVAVAILALTLCACSGVKADLLGGVVGGLLGGLLTVVGSVLDCLLGNPQLSIVVDLFKSCNLGPYLSDYTKPCTVFAPYNGAFNGYNLVDIKADVNLAALLKLHIAIGLFDQKAFAVIGAKVKINTYYGKPLLVVNVGGNLLHIIDPSTNYIIGTCSSIPTVVTDSYGRPCGYVYQLQQVLVPCPSYCPSPRPFIDLELGVGLIPIDIDVQLSILGRLLADVNLLVTLGSPSQYWTLWAPWDNAFTGVDLVSLEADVNLLGLLKAHITLGVLDFNTLTIGNRVHCRNLYGYDLIIVNIGGGYYNIIDASSGVDHILCSCKLAPTLIYDVDKVLRGVIIVLEKILLPSYCPRPTALALI